MNRGRQVPKCRMWQPDCGRVCKTVDKQRDEAARRPAASGCNTCSTKALLPTADVLSACVIYWQSGVKGATDLLTVLKVWRIFWQRCLRIQPRNGVIIKCSHIPNVCPYNWLYSTIKTYSWSTSWFRMVHVLVMPLNSQGRTLVDACRTESYCANEHVCVEKPQWTYGFVYTSRHSKIWIFETHILEM